MKKWICFFVMATAALCVLPSCSREESGATQEEPDNSTFRLVLRIKGKQVKAELRSSWEESFLTGEVLPISPGGTTNIRLAYNGAGGLTLRKTYVLKPTWRGLREETIDITQWGRDAASGLSWAIINGQMTITGTDYYDFKGNIPAALAGKSVTSIGDEAFSNCFSLTSVTIPNNVTSIGRAFEGCSSLTSVTIPSSITSIGDRAFGGCSSLTSVTIPSSITSIGDQAFAWCKSLTSVTIPSSITSIGDRAFSNCSSLTSVTIPNSVTSIGGYTFLGCSSLTSVTIPNSVTSIEAWAFGGCESLTSVTIPNSVTSIGVSAFWGCESLTSVTIPKGVEVGEDAFKGCPWQPK